MGCVEMVDGFENQTETAVTQEFNRLEFGEESANI